MIREAGSLPGAEMPPEFFCPDLHFFIDIMQCMVYTIIEPRE